ncbi:MAG: hypothetical protein KF802_01235 [Bdellovibrionaceae bacterium]|nr:hypothetical protein [Pseudobdellovibrionaceae bacterium]
MEENQPIPPAREVKTADFASLQIQLYDLKNHVSIVVQDLVMQLQALENKENEP